MKAPVSGTLADYREIWNRKPALRLIYDDLYDRVAAACRAGLTIEIGGGIGSLKQKLKDAITTDIQYAPWLDWSIRRLPGAAQHSIDFSIMSRCGPRPTCWSMEFRILVAILTNQTRPFRPCS